MNNNQLQQLRQTLEEELATLQQFINDELPVDETELSAVDNHPADAATDLTTVVTELTLNELKEEEIERIKTALTAMDEGTYGKCAVCGENIPFGRLEAIPTALTCIDHAEIENVE
ncbi:TraR/DksA family transcriptional regulator [Solibacillus merdavium]|uniref:TraR/DksA C4-type zinc finger protein n=1 Tax=Solibacillus merdavium TaxID=2762218 RepID=A0ABR8XS26_9BACL|nr:TraR/DksA C4-type zinc finger protein [Solibacillus merdavium]MBD8034741.1 TraR/DksA C4-type zinc finger protein [Solibacillus merdavium]